MQWALFIILIIFPISVFALLLLSEAEFRFYPQLHVVVLPDLEHARKHAQPRDVQLAEGEAAWAHVHNTSGKDVLP